MIFKRQENRLNVPYCTIDDCNIDDCTIDDCTVDDCTDYANSEINMLNPIYPDLMLAESLGQNMHRVFY